MPVPSRVALQDWLNPNWPFVGGATPQDPVSGPLASYFDLHPATGRQTFNVSRFAAQALNGAVPTSVLSQLPALAPIMPWAAAIDGSPAGLTDLPLRVLQSGNFNKVPVVLGSNKNEGTIFMPLMSLIVKDVPLFPLPLSDSSLASVIEHALDMFPAGASCVVMHHDASRCTNCHVTMRRGAVRTLMNTCKLHRLNYACAPLGYSSFQLAYR